MSSKQFNNQVGEIVRASFYLQDAGFYCVVAYQTEDAKQGEAATVPASVSASIYNCREDYLNAKKPVFFGYCREGVEPSAATIARKMESMIPA